MFPNIFQKCLTMSKEISWSILSDGFWSEVEACEKKCYVAPLEERIEWTLETFLSSSNLLKSQIRSSYTVPQIYLVLSIGIKEDQYQLRQINLTTFERTDNYKCRSFINIKGPQFLLRLPKEEIMEWDEMEWRKQASNFQIWFD